nr:hypothetical protein CFP56_70533 [Quercus suber]
MRQPVSCISLTHARSRVSCAQHGIHILPTSLLLPTQKQSWELEHIVCLPACALHHHNNASRKASFMPIWQHVSCSARVHFTGLMVHETLRNRLCDGGRSPRWATRRLVEWTFSSVRKSNDHSRSSTLTNTQSLFNDVGGSQPDEWLAQTSKHQKRDVLLPGPSESSHSK